MGHCGQKNDVYCTAKGCGQSMHVRDNPLFGMVCKLEEADHVLREVTMSKGNQSST